MQSARHLSHAEAAAILNVLRSKAEAAAIDYRRRTLCSKRRMVTYANGVLTGLIMRYERTNGVRLPRK